LAGVALLASAECTAQQRRQIDNAGSHVVLSAPAAIGGPRLVRGSAGVRFPLAPAGALDSGRTLAAPRRPVAKPGTRLAQAATGGGSHRTAAAHAALVRAAPGRSAAVPPATHGSRSAAKTRTPGHGAGAEKAVPAEARTSPPSKE
jgi:hypothetical protein